MIIKDFLGEKIYLISKDFYRALRFNYIVHFVSPRKKVGNYEKCFVIGMPKTGTTSMKDFLESHGSKHLTFNKRVNKFFKFKKFNKIKYLTSRFDSFDDFPWNDLKLIEFFMKSNCNYVFIYTMRDPNIRFESLIRYHIKRKKLPPKEHERGKYVKNHIYHENYCRKIAKKYNANILFIDVTTNKKSSQILKNFLGLERDIPFPHSNIT